MGMALIILGLMKAAYFAICGLIGSLVFVLLLSDSSSGKKTMIVITITLIATVIGFAYGVKMGIDVFQGEVEAL